MLTNINYISWMHLNFNTMHLPLIYIIKQTDMHVTYHAFTTAAVVRKLYHVNLTPVTLSFQISLLLFCHLVLLSITRVPTTWYNLSKIFYTLYVVYMKSISLNICGSVYVCVCVCVEIRKEKSGRNTWF